MDRIILYGVALLVVAQRYLGTSSSVCSCWKGPIYSWPAANLGTDGTSRPLRVPDHACLVSGTPIAPPHVSPDLAPRQAEDLPCPMSSGKYNPQVCGINGCVDG